MSTITPVRDEQALASPAIGRDEVVGIDESSHVLGGPPVRYVNLDNAATTPALRSVLETVTEFLPTYSSVHRGTGAKSRFSTFSYERARELVRAFVGADPERDTVVFGRHTTDAINLLAGSIVLAPDDVVLTTAMALASTPYRQSSSPRIWVKAAMPAFAAP